MNKEPGGTTAKHRPRKEWAKEAVCTDYPSLFTSNEKESSVKICRSICKKCPVLDECLTWALAHENTVGIWAGTNTRQRAIITQKANLPDLSQIVPKEPSIQDYVKNVVQEPESEVVQNPQKVLANSVSFFEAFPELAGLEDLPAPPTKLEWNSLVSFLHP